MVLRDGEVDLERSADGLRNWRLSNPDYRGPGRYKVLSLQAERASLRFRHEGADLDLRASARPSDVTGAEAAAALPTQIEIEGEWRRLPFKVSAATGSGVDLSRDRPDVFAARFRHGWRRPARPRRRARRHRSRAARRRPNRSRRAFARAVRGVHRSRRGTTSRATRVAGTLKAGGGSYALTSAEARIGATDLAGELGWKRGDERSTVRAHLTSDSAEVADLRWLSALRPVAMRAIAPATIASAAVSSAPVASAPARALARSIDADLSLAARRLHAADLPWLQSAKVDATLVDGQLSVPRFDVGFAQGHGAGHASVDMRERPLRAEVDLALRGARVEQLLREPAGKERIRGALQGRAQLRASGDSAETTARERQRFDHAGTRRRHDFEPARRRDRLAGRQDPAQLRRRRRADRDPLRRRRARARPRRCPSAKPRARQRTNADRGQRDDRPRARDVRPRAHARGEAARVPRPRSLDSSARPAASAGARAGRARRHACRGGTRLPCGATLIRA